MPSSQDARNGSDGRHRYGTNHNSHWYRGNANAGRDNKEDSHNGNGYPNGGFGHFSGAGYMAGYPGYYSSPSDPTFGYNSGAPK